MYSRINEINFNVDEIIAKSELFVAIKNATVSKEDVTKFIEMIKTNNTMLSEDVPYLLYDLISDVYSDVKLTKEECNIQNLANLLYEKYLEMFKMIFIAADEVFGIVNEVQSEFFAKYTIVQIFIIEQDCPISLKRESLDSIITTFDDISSFSLIEKSYLNCYIQLLLKSESVDIALLKKCTDRLKFLISK